MRFRNRPTRANAVMWGLALGSALLLTITITAPATAGASSAGPTKVVVTKYGFSVTLPSGWQKVTLTKTGIAKMAQRVKKLDPTLGSQLS